MNTVNITDLRPHLSEYADDVYFHGERIVVERKGKPAFAMVTVEDFEVIEALEEKIDIHEAKKALAKGKFIPLEELEAELNL
jgi:prevent-host-death family protein